VEGCCVILKLGHISFTPMQTLASYTQTKHIQFLSTSSSVSYSLHCVSRTSGVPRNFVPEWGGVQQIQLRTEDRENGDLGAVTP